LKVPVDFGIEIFGEEGICCEFADGSGLFGGVSI
jgi:hypothetical protein